MKLLARLCILVISALTVLALPKIEPRSLADWEEYYKSQAACNAKYQNEQQLINEQINIQSAVCISNANSTVNQTEGQTSAQINMARNNLTILETNLNNCSSISDNFGFITCVNNNHEENENLLNNAYAITLFAQNQFDAGDDKQSQCLAQVLETAANNFLVATEEYNQCMNNVSKHWNLNCRMQSGVLVCT